MTQSLIKCGHFYLAQCGHYYLGLTLLLEMRTWLQSSQSILAAAAQKDFPVVSLAAKASVMGAEVTTPSSLFRKLPVDMKKLGFDTRQKFDQIAADAEKNKDSNLTITQCRVIASLNSVPARLPTEIK